MDHPLIRRLRQLDTIDSDEEEAMLDALAREREIARGQEIVAQGSRPQESNFILSGFAARQRIMHAGSRQFTSVHIVGDFIDLHSFLLAAMDHSIIALTDCRIGIVPHKNLRRITEEHPHLGRVLWLVTLIDGAIHREWVAALGRRSAEQHMAHLICELYVRLDSVGAASDGRFFFPLTQSEVADSLGLSTVHVNRVLQSQRRTSLVDWRGQEIHIRDFKGLAEMAEFDPTYLNLEGKPL
jgi:CRP-like cAMP-binding protein